jgi:tRNA/tmRNA/rRNA uracil-C5-methylase (TrmA/RlmC/RlmD family)
MRGCRVDHPRIAAALDELEDAARARGVTPWDEATGRGALRYAWAKTDGERVLLTLFEGREGAVDRGLADALRGADGVAFAPSGGRGNAIRGEVAPRIARGIDAIEVAGERVGPGGFLQPNPAVIEAARAELLVDEAGAPLGGGLAWDLYAGAGVTARRLAARFERVEAVESDPALTDAPRSVEEVVTAFVAGAEVPALVVANPPRKGLGPVVAEALARIGPPRIHLMSCGPEGLARDLARLPAYEPVAISAWDTLPQTPHVELVVRLRRRG